MKKPTENAAGPVKDSEEEIFRKHGVQVTDMAERGIRAIGVLGGVRRQDQQPSKDLSPADPKGGPRSR